MLCQKKTFRSTRIETSSKKNGSFQSHHHSIMNLFLLWFPCFMVEILFCPQHYSQILHDFAEDDHDHAVSVTSLSVQIYTVPTVVSSTISSGTSFIELLLGAAEIAYQTSFCLAEICRTPVTFCTRDMVNWMVTLIC